MYFVTNYVDSMTMYLILFFFVLTVYEPDEWEVDRENVKLLRELGQGSFGMVYEGIVKNLMPEPIRVAVKTTTNNSTDRDRIQFLQEASIMK